MSVRAHVRLELKLMCDWQVGAQVMLLRNLELTGNDRMLVNGSRGVITKFIPKAVRTSPALPPRLLPAHLSVAMHAHAGMPWMNVMRTPALPPLPSPGRQPSLPCTCTLHSHMLETLCTQSSFALHGA